MAAKRPQKFEAIDRIHLIGHESIKRRWLDQCHLRCNPRQNLRHTAVYHQPHFNSFHVLTSERPLSFHLPLIAAIVGSSFIMMVSTLASISALFSLHNMHVCQRTGLHIYKLLSSLPGGWRGIARCAWLLERRFARAHTDWHSHRELQRIGGFPTCTTTPSPIFHLHHSTVSIGAAAVSQPSIQRVGRVEASGHPAHNSKGIVSFLRPGL
jgi:hypothetical protein